MLRKAVLVLSLLMAQPAIAKDFAKLDIKAGVEQNAGVGDVMLRITLRESLPNAFGGPDIFGRKRDTGLIELRFMGIAQDGKAVFRRREVGFYNNETTMSRSGFATGSATITQTGNVTTVQSVTSSAPTTTITPISADTFEIALDLSASSSLVIKGYTVQIKKADNVAVQFVVIAPARK